MNGRTSWHWLLKPQKLLQLQWKNSATVKLRKKEQAQSFLLWADLLQAGFSIKHALAFSCNVHPRLSPFFRAVDDNMKRGNTFANSLRPFITPDLYYQLLIAEKHGDLPKTISEIGKLMVSQERQKKKLLALLQYPLILLVMLGGLIICLAIFVFPELQAWQVENTSRIGTVTSSLMGWGTYILTVLVVSIIFQWWHWHKTSFEKRVIKLCRAPLIGQCYRYYYHYYLTSILAMMLKRGMSLKEICTLTTNFDQRSLLHFFGAVISQKVQTGEKLDQVIYRYPFLPDELIVFLNKGATVERIGKDLAVFSVLQFKKLTTAIERLLIYVQPIVFSIIALVIVFLYLSILLPIYHSLQGVY